MSVECTVEACLARSNDEVDRACAASPACRACLLRTSLRANGEYTDDAEVLRPTPPGRPFTRGGKGKARASVAFNRAQQKHSLRHRVLSPVTNNFSSRP